jgi:tRNA(adenine34) deaminase
LLNDVTAHAEMQAITAAANYLGEVFERLHTLCNAGACQMLSFILSQISKIVYGVRGYAQRLKLWNAAPSQDQRCKRSFREAANLMKRFFTSKRK